MDLIYQAYDLFINLHHHLPRWEAQLGTWLLVVLFAIIFCETGLVVTPFLPGDSLLFALGTRAADARSPLDFWSLCILLIVAGVLGDAVNYMMGYYVGPKVFSKEDSRFFNKKHLLRTQKFYEKYGGKTIIIARFVPIVRTFAPFVAGIGKMRYFQFAMYNVAGAILWVVICLSAGYWFGELPWVKNNFSLVILGIIVVSVMPIVIELYLARRRGPESATPASDAAPASGLQVESPAKSTVP